MDVLDLLVYLMVFYTVVLIPIAWVLWEVVRPWAKCLRRDWKAFRTERRMDRKRAEYNQWKETGKWIA